VEAIDANDSPSLCCTQNLKLSLHSKFFTVTLAMSANLMFFASLKSRLLFMLFFTTENKSESRKKIAPLEQSKSIRCGLGLSGWNWRYFSFFVTTQLKTDSRAKKK
jgi:hypothetical protein